MKFVQVTLYEYPVQDQARVLSDNQEETAFLTSMSDYIGELNDWTINPVELGDSIDFNSHDACTSGITTSLIKFNSVVERVGCVATYNE